MPSLQRFLDAQDTHFDAALRELRAGKKQSHWMWFIFPQIDGLGSSGMSRFYAVAGLEEARDYLAHPVLALRLQECTRALLGWRGKRSAAEILGPVDAQKFASSMTLFEAAGGPPLYSAALGAFCRGARDLQTLALLEQSASYGKGRPVNPPVQQPVPQAADRSGAPPHRPLPRA